MKGCNSNYKAVKVGNIRVTLLIIIHKHKGYGVVNIKCHFSNKQQGYGISSLQDMGMGKRNKNEV